MLSKLGRALGAKYDVVNSMDLRGVGMFTLDYGGGSPELWNLLAAKFTTVTAWDSLGGFATSFRVHVEVAATHITMNPVAVNIQCHSARRASAIITPGGISFV